MRHVVIDANVLISFFYRRNEEQRAAAKELLLLASDGELVVVLPQFVIFEVVHVFRHFYGVPVRDVATVVRDVLAYPGVTVTDECPWSDVLDQWQDSQSSIADSAIVTLALRNRYDAVATFDHKLKTRMKSLGVASYW